MKKVLIVLSEHGYWGEELVGPLEILDNSKYEAILATPTGKRPHNLPVSTNPDFIDPPLDRTVTTPEMAENVKRLDASSRLDNPLNIAAWIPERPYLSAKTYLRELERYYHNLEQIDDDIKEYRALLLIGGSGPIVDMANNQRAHDLILAFYRANLPIAAECYGVACLAFARDVRIRKNIIWGRHVTGHPIEYDYKDGTGFLGTDFNMGPPPYPLEYILRDAVGPAGQYHGNVGNKTSVIVDYPFITSRSTASSILCAQILVEVLERGLKRYGW